MTSLFSMSEHYFKMALLGPIVELLRMVPPGVAWGVPVKIRRDIKLPVPVFLVKTFDEIPVEKSLQVIFSSFNTH